MQDAEFFKNGRCLKIAYLDEGEGEPIVLVHGFCLNQERQLGLFRPGFSELKKNGRRVIALRQSRPTAISGKLYDAEAYSIPTMAGDVSALMDHLDIARAAGRHGLFARCADDGPAWRCVSRSGCARRFSGGNRHGPDRGRAAPGEKRRGRRWEADSLDEVLRSGGTDVFARFADQTRFRPARAPLPPALRGHATG